MELYSGPVPSLNEMFDFEQTGSTDAERAIGLCVADTLNTLYGWLEIDNVRGGFENHTTTLCHILGIDPNRFLEYNAGESSVALDIDRPGLKEIFESGDRKVNVFGIVDYTLRKCVRDAKSAIDYDFYSENFRAVNAIEDALEAQITSPIIDLNKLNMLMLQYVDITVTDKTEKDALAYHLATMYTAGVAYTALLSQNLE
jgi:hypothetical protein